MPYGQPEPGLNPHIGDPLLHRPLCADTFVHLAEFPDSVRFLIRVYPRVKVHS